MRSASTVGIVLTSILLIYFGITLFGSLEPFTAGLIFFTIATVICILAVLGSKKLKKLGSGFLIFEILVICASLSFLIGSARLYQIGSEKRDIALQDSVAEARHLADLNQYYSEYITHLDNQLSNYMDSNNNLRSKIDAAKQATLTEQAAAIDLAHYEQRIEEDYRFEDDDRYEHKEDDDD